MNSVTFLTIHCTVWFFSINTFEQYDFFYLYTKQKDLSIYTMNSVTFTCYTMTTVTFPIYIMNSVNFLTMQSTIWFYTMNNETFFFINLMKSDFNYIMKRDFFLSM